MKPLHAHRPGGTTTKRRKQHGPAADYAPGYFTADIREHNWPPRFESRGDWRSKRDAAPHVISERSRAGQGFDANPLGLPGAVPHVKQWESRKAREAGK